MKAIMISIKPEWCAKILNCDKIIEVRKNKALATAIQKLIDENGYADIYVYCSKGNKKHWHLIEVVDTDTGWEGYEYDYYIGSEGYLDHCLEGKVIVKLTINKVEEWDIRQEDLEEKLKLACLSIKEFDDYSKGQVAYAIHFMKIAIFNKPKELKEFYRVGKMQSYKDCQHLLSKNDEKYYKLTKAPQNYVFIEKEDN